MRLPKNSSIQLLLQDACVHAEHGTVSTSEWRISVLHQNVVVPSLGELSRALPDSAYEDMEVGTTSDGSKFRALEKNEL